MKIILAEFQKIKITPKSVLILSFFLLFFSNNKLCFSQETYPARVVSGPNFAQELFHLQLPQIKSEVPNLVNLELSFGIANWYWTCSPSVATATMSINVDIGEVKYTGFVMKHPNGGEKRVSFQEIGINPDKNPSICDIKLDIEFGKFNTRATAEIDLNNSGKGQGNIRFSNELPKEFYDFLKFDHQEKRYKTVQEIFSGLDPQVSISHHGTYNCKIRDFKSNFYLRQIRNYIEKEYEEFSLKSKITNLLADAQNAESFGKIDEAIQKYEEAYNLNQDPEIKSKIDDLKARKQADENQQANSNTDNSSVSNTQNNSSNIQNNNSNSYSSNISTANNTDIQYNREDWTKYNQMQQNVNNWNQDWYNRIETGEQLRKQKQEMYDQEVQKFANNLVSYLEKIEQDKQQREINKASKAIDVAVSNAFWLLQRETNYLQKFMSDMLTVTNKYSKNLNKIAFDELESNLDAIKRTLEDIEYNHNYLQDKLKKDWDYADNDPRKFRLRFWKEYNYTINTNINLSQTFTIGSKISDKNTRCRFVNDLLPLINQNAERSQAYRQITSIEQAYKASGCSNYNYESLLKNAKAIETYEKIRNEKISQIYTLKKKIEEELIEIKILESKSINVENISNKAEIEGVDLQDLKNEYNNLKNNIGVFASHIHKLNPDILIKNHGGKNQQNKEVIVLLSKSGNTENKSSYVFKPSGIYVTSGEFEITFSKEFSTPKEHKVTLNAQKGQKSLTIDPKTYDSAFEFDRRFKPYNVNFANKYQKKNNFGKTRWLVPEFKFYTSGIAEFNLTPASLVESYSPKGFYKGRPVFFHRLDFLTLKVGKGSFINGFITSDNSAYYRLHSNFDYFGVDILRYEPGFTMSIFKSNAELRVFGGGAVSLIKFRVNEKEDNAVYGSSTITEDKVENRGSMFYVYPGLKYVQRMGKATLQIGYNYNILIEYDNMSEEKKSNLDEFLYHEYTPFNDIGKFFQHEFSVRYTF